MFWLSIFFGSLSTDSGVTFEKNGGRLGDNLLSFISAAWFSHKYNIPLFLNPFDYSDQLMLDNLPHYNPKSHTFKKTIHYSKKLSFDHYKTEKDTLFITSFYNRPKPNMKDEIFRTKMRQLIAPKQQCNLLQLPSDCTTVALHVRTGGGFSMDEKLYKKYPLRFVPIHFYADQLKTVLQEFPGQKLYVYIFTDDQNPAYIVEYLTTHVSNELITFDYRLGKNRHNLNVIEDFFSMIQFDVLIRPVSNFSKIAEYLGNFKLVIIPTNAYWISNDKWIIDSVKTVRSC